MGVPTLTEKEIQRRIARAQQFANSPEGRQRIAERNLRAKKATELLQAKRRLKDWMMQRAITI